MFTTPYKGSSPTQAPSSTPRTKGPGLFEDGQWLCMSTPANNPFQCANLSPANHVPWPSPGDCSPRRPAPYFQVKKENHNKGKWFYTCDKRKCRFFLFDDDAKPREREALLRHNCRSENGIVARVQAKGEPPATPTFPPKNTTSGSIMGAVTAPPAQRPQQRIFRGLPPRSSMSQDSDGLSFDTDDDADGPVTCGAGSNNKYHGTISSSQTMRNSGGSKVSGVSGVTADRMPGFTFQQQQQQSPATPSAGKSNNSKRKRAVFDDSDDGLLGDSDFDDPDTEQQLAALADASAPRAMPQTPSAGRGGGAMMPTPVSRNSLLIAAEDSKGTKGAKSAKRARHSSLLVDEDDEDDKLFASQGRLLFPTPGLKTRAPGSGSLGLGSAGAPSPPPHVQHPEIADEVMGLLAREPISETARAQVRAAMDRHELRVLGVARGRDAARAALQARDERIAELQASVVALNNARRFERAQLAEVSQGLIRLSQQDE